MGGGACFGPPCAFAFGSPLPGLICIAPWPAVLPRSPSAPPPPPAISLPAWVVCICTPAPLWTTTAASHPAADPLAGHTPSPLSRVLACKPQPTLPVLPPPLGVSCSLARAVHPLRLQAAAAAARSLLSALACSLSLPLPPPIVPCSALRFSCVSARRGGAKQKKKICIDGSVAAPPAGQAAAAAVPLWGGGVLAATRTLFGCRYFARRHQMAPSPPTRVVAPPEFLFVLLCPPPLPPVTRARLD